ncbi:CCR4-NOT transcription complex subunit 6-like [Diaphorina citri]|uniref:CCR4-NOT transcription complex subunit 6-like n=1 Tax=Diaphorina citri TaxID=121845 RepID=A0A1S3DG43_DIACI|nr:CCR4-NOT transcription complex subunit 6-like [Diaphorina citri]
MYSTIFISIFCFQEVETDQFYKFFLPELKSDGYDGIFSPKSRAKTMAENDRKYVDGCAIFYRTAKFSLIKEHLIEFNQLAMANSEGSDDMLNRVMPKDNIGLAALLKTKEAAWDNVVDLLTLRINGKHRKQGDDVGKSCHIVNVMANLSVAAIGNLEILFHFKGIIDYIFYSKQNMTPLGLLGPLNQDWLKENKVIGCPHPHIPSGGTVMIKSAPGGNQTQNLAFTRQAPYPY